MKLTLVIAAIVSLASFIEIAYADQGTLVCVAGSLKADGTFAMVSGNPAQVAVLQNGSVSLYSLKDPFSLYNTNYNIHSPFDLSLVTPYGAAGGYLAMGYADSAKWTISDDGTQKMIATLTADSNTGAGHLTTDTSLDSNGAWMGSTEDNLACTTAGVK